MPASCGSACTRQFNGGPHLVEIAKLFEARHPQCTVSFLDIGLEQIYTTLRAGRVDMLATRLPINEDGLTIGAVLSKERRVVAVARDHPLAVHASVSIEQVAEYGNGEPPGLPAELMDAFVPRHTPSGRPWPRVPVRSFSEAVMRVALGQLVHATVDSWVDHHYHHPMSSRSPSTTCRRQRPHWSGSPQAALPK